MKIAFILYDGFSPYDFASLFEPLALLKTLGLQSELQWELCALQETVSDGQNLPYHATWVGQKLDQFDLVIVPGCMDAGKPLADESLLDWLGSASKTPWLAAVGNGALLFAAAGLLQDKKVASGSDTREILAEYGAQPIEEELVEDDAIFTAASSQSALKLAFSLCAQLAGLGAAQQVRARWGGEAQAGIPTEFTSDRAASSGEGLRFARVARKTLETNIELELELDGAGEHQVETGLPFLDHMLAQVAVHGLFNLKLKAAGDLQIDPHHTMEDVALALGEAFRLALGERRGIARMGSALCPMDESLAWVAVDLSGRPYAVVAATWHTPSVGGLPASLFKHFLESFAQQARCNLHARVVYGKDDHHQAEALFKALGRALDVATQIDERRAGEVPSTKGMLV